MPLAQILDPSPDRLQGPECQGLLLMLNSDETPDPGPSCPDPGFASGGSGLHTSLCKQIPGLCETHNKHLGMSYNCWDLTQALVPILHAPCRTSPTPGAPGVEWTQRDHEQAEMRCLLNPSRTRDIRGIMHDPEMHAAPTPLSKKDTSW